MKIRTTVWGDVDDLDLGALILHTGLTRFMLEDNPEAQYYTDDQNHIWLNGVIDLGCNAILASFVDCGNTLMHGHPLWKGQTAAARAGYSVKVGE